MDVRTLPTVEDRVINFLREYGALERYTRTQCDTALLGLTTCVDDRMFWEQSDYVRRKNNRGITPVPFAGGAIRFSPHCPQYGDAVRWREFAIGEIRLAQRARGFLELAFSVHGPECAVARDLNITVAQRIWHAVAARKELKRTAHAQRWHPAGGDFGVVCCYHHGTVDANGEERHKTYHIRHDHSLFRDFPLSFMNELSDEEFLARLPNLVAPIGVP